MKDAPVTFRALLDAIAEKSEEELILEEWLILIILPCGKTIKTRIEVREASLNNLLVFDKEKKSG